MSNPYEDVPRPELPEDQAAAGFDLCKRYPEALCVYDCAGPCEYSGEDN